MGDPEDGGSPVEPSDDVAWLERYEGLDVSAILVLAAEEDRVVRIIGPHDAVTMDYRPDRLNLDVDDARALLRVWAG
ncbi:I78 family peptidase inhibitor [Mumia sp. DW29H23]|uniref:I78 family peptidase inhibitor n=1 Tax=Mumia sp. DW29H23 TaxID=3421241 RepID=UPI003D68BAA6